MSDIINAVRDALGNHHYLYLYGIAIVLLLVLLKGRRKAFVVPCILISLMVLNPVFYKAWNSINNYGYWRTLWMIPIIPICAAAPAVLVEKGKKQWIKGIFVALSAAMFVYAGAFIYHNPATRFTKAENTEKLPSDAVLLADALLELDDMPFVVADNEICIFLRQYSGKIRSLFARDMFYWNPSELAKKVYAQLSAQNGDLQEVAQSMLNHDYEYLIVNNAQDEKKTALREAGFEFVQQVNDYSIYRVTGNPTEIREYNNLHQVTAKICVDENGNPINGPEGYAKRTYVYDQMGNVIKRFQTDVSGNAVLEKTGEAGFEREFNRFGQMTKEIWLGADGNPVEAGGYVMRICHYNSDNELESENYYDEAENPMLRTDKLFAERRMTYDDNGNKTSERYYGLDGKLTISSYGYAGFEHEYDEKDRLVKESYIGLDGGPLSIEAGYCAFVREYDDAGNVTAEYYLNDKGERTVCAKGYAFVGREYNENGKVIHEWYEDSEGSGVVSASGYAGFTRKYDESGDVIEIRYLDTEGKEAPGDQGYSRVSRVYDTDNRLLRENYYNGEAPYTVSEGYAGFIRLYDSNGNLTKEQYFDEQGKPVNSNEGYAYAQYTYDDHGKKLEDSYYDAEGLPAEIGIGYSKCIYTYTEDEQLSLIYYLDQQDQQVKAGSGYLHEYFQSLEGRDISILLAVRDEASKNMTVTLCEDMKRLGIQTDLRGQYRKSFYAIVTPDGITEELSDEELSCDGFLDDIAYSIMSAGYYAGKSCSIVVDGEEYAKNVRGLNIVVFDNVKKKVEDTIAFDTYKQEMNVTR